MPDSTTPLPSSVPSDFLSVAGPSMNPSPTTASTGHDSPSRLPARSYSLSNNGRLSSAPRERLQMGGLLQPPKGMPSPTSPSSFRRSLSEEDNHAKYSRTHETNTAELDPAQSALFQSARRKMSSQDNEAMKKLRSSMLDFSDSSASSASTSPLSPLFPAGAPSSSRDLRPRRSTLSKQLLPEDEDVNATPMADKTPVQVNNRPSSSADHVIAVIGHGGVGKSTVIRRALKNWGMSSPVSMVTQNGSRIFSCISEVQPSGHLKTAFAIEFIEMDLSALNLTSSPSAIWPTIVPQVSGVMMCYDATRKASLRGLDDALRLLSARGTPMVILACKSDPDVSHEVDAPSGNSLGEPYNVGLIEVSQATSEGKAKMRNALRWLLHKLEQRQRRQQRKAAATVSLHPSPSPSTANPSASPKNNNTDSDTSTGSHLLWQQGHRMTAIGADHDGMSSTPSSSSSLQWMMTGPLQHQEPLVPADPTQLKAEKQVQLESQGEKTGGQKITEPPPYASLEDLLNQLFTAIVSTQDEPFVRAFLMTYRRFCYPRDLMQEFLDRFKEVEQYAVAKDIRHWALMKMTGALIDWTARYPGDLASADTQSIFHELLNLILKYTFMAHLTVDLVAVEQSLPGVIDIDSSWSIKKLPSLSLVSHSPEESRSASELMVDGELIYELESSLDKVSIDSPASKHTHSSKSMSTTSLIEADAAAMMRKRSGSDPRLMDFTTNSTSISEGSASSSGPRSTHSNEEVGNGRWAPAVLFVMTSDPKQFAMDITRLQWELFSAIRPRDIFRHDFGKETDDPVGKSIAFFNYLSRWVSTIIIASPKAKYRARVFEVFMVIAHQLRRLNNYDSLYAVISGMRETSVHRLTMTHQLVKASALIEKDYQSHLKLMDPRGGYTHYRRALAADISHGRAAIPLLTTMLGLVNRLQVVRPQDRREDGLIQWDKFAKLGDILSIIPECQSKGPIVPLPVSNSFRNLIYGTNIIEDEDGLFARSKILEPGNAGVVKKRLNYLGGALRGDWDFS
ncbi:hypothetical protein P7C73_g2543, partial [Tremellales sp. Uapishka_1]